MITVQQLQDQLDRLVVDYKVPGAAVAVADGETVVSAHMGCANIVTGQPVRRDTLFAAGSVTKVFTAALVMSLVDDGLVDDLDAPVQRYLPEFRLADAEASKLVSVRMLLNHTAGIPGHCMFNLPRSPDVLAQQVALLRDYPFNSPPGQYWSYSNGGMAVAGRLTEVLRRQPWDDALAERILRPLGLHATTRAEEMVLDSTAVGHLVDASGAVGRAPRLLVDSSNGPAGATLWCDIDAMIAFGQMHLRGGRAADGTPVLTAESVGLMQTPSLAPRWGLGFDNWGLGWYINGTGADQTLGHTGGNIGMHSILTIAPQRGCAVAVLTNSTAGAAVTSGLTRELLHDLHGISAAVPPAAPDTPVDVELDRYVGRYEADEGTLTVTRQDGRLRVVQELGPHLIENLEVIVPGSLPLPPLTLTPFAADGRFLSAEGAPVTFVDGGAFAYVGRIFRRVATG